MRFRQKSHPKILVSLKLQLTLQNTALRLLGEFPLVINLKNIILELNAKLLDKNICDLHFHVNSVFAKLYLALGTSGPSQGVT